jgi:hypothetical protein
MITSPPLRPHPGHALHVGLAGSELRGPRRGFPNGAVVGCGAPILWPRSSAHTTIDATSAWPFACGDVNAQLSAIRGLDVAGGTDRRTHYFGLVSDGAGFMRGCASGIPQTPDPTTVASGPTGNSGFSWDTDGCYGDWYTGHELGHTFGRFHPGFCGETHDDSSYPFRTDNSPIATRNLSAWTSGTRSSAYPCAHCPGLIGMMS